MRKSRGKNDQIQTPEKDHDNERLESPSKVGRPSLGDNPMTPNTYSNRRRSQTRESYKSKKTSEARTQAAAKR